MSVTVRLDRSSKVYRAGESVSGVVALELATMEAPLTHAGVELKLEGNVSMQFSAKASGLFDVFNAAAKPIELLTNAIELCPAGKLAQGRTEWPFSLDLPTGPALYETYHGVFINIVYMLSAELRRPLLAANLRHELEVFVESVPIEGKPMRAAQAASFSIVPESVDSVVRAKGPVPRFRITGKLNSVVCPMEVPVEGEVRIDESDASVQSIEAQLVRIETTSSVEGHAREATEIQSIQVADGDVHRGWEIPIHMILPRLFTCPTVVTRQFRLEFEVRLVISFVDGHILTESFPIEICRAGAAGGLAR